MTSVKNKKITLASDLISETEEMLRKRGSEPDLSLKTLPVLNKKIWGLKKQKLTLVGARTSHGKSAMALQMAYDIASQGKAVAYLSLEMYYTDLMERLFCLHQRVDNFELLTGKFDSYAKNWSEFKDSLKNTPLAISDCIGKTWKEVDDLVDGFGSKPELVILDYIQNISGGSVEMKSVIDEYIRHLREMAIHNDFAIVVCSQVNRTSQESSSKEPQLHQLKGSGFLEEHSDIILLLHWPYKYDEKKPKEDYTMFVAKNRNGRTGYVNLKYTPEFYLFEDKEAPTQYDKMMESMNKEMAKK
jgi:replicative DNA helicase